MATKGIVPFLKWAGGKRWLTSRHGELFPEEIGTSFEPFLGSGAVFFHLQPKVAILSDINVDLINTYLAIRDSWEEVCNLLQTHHRKHSKNYYYKIRNTIFEKSPEKAARFIYLNRTCWNGLYRVNRKGGFNVPIGTKTSVIMESDKFEELSKLLQKVQLISLDFENLIDQSKKNDFVFLDPPYAAKHTYNGFLKYNELLFSWNDQIRLKGAVQRAVDRGVKILLTNANHPSIRELYQNIKNVTTIERPSVLAASATNRGKVEELVIRSWS